MPPDDKRADTASRSIVHAKAIKELADLTQFNDRFQQMRASVAR